MDKLNHARINGLKPREKAYKVADGRGLYVLVTPAGGRLWRLKYRFCDREKSLALGAYPEVSLKLARNRRDDARRALADGIDPGKQRKDEELVKRDTFQAVADEWLAGRRDITAKTLHLARQRLEKWVFPYIGNLPITSVEASDVLDALRRVESSGNYVTARRTRQICGRVFRYAVASGRASRDPTPDLRGALIPTVTKSRSAIVDPVGVGALMTAIDAYHGEFVTKAALLFLAQTFVRQGELRRAVWSEFELDAEAPIWRISAERMKMRRDHLVPLSRQSVALLERLRPLTANSAFAFPSKRPRRPLSENTLNMALRAMGYSGDVMTAHGFRSTASTLLHEQQFPHEVIELQLAHTRSDVAGVYNRSARLPERRTMMQRWADYLDRLRTGAEVVPLRDRG